MGTMLITSAQVVNGQLWIEFELEKGVIVTEWRKAKCETGDCVETRETEAGVFVRSSKDVDIDVFFTKDEWRTFVQAVKVGAFDI